MVSPHVWSIFVGQDRGPYKRARLYDEKQRASIINIFLLEFPLKIDVTKLMTLLEHVTNSYWENLKKHMEHVRGQNCIEWHEMS